MITNAGKAGWCDGCNRATESIELIIYGSYKNSRAIRLCPKCRSELMETLREIRDGEHDGGR